MTDAALALSFQPMGLREGVWHGLLQAPGPTPPNLRATLAGQDLPPPVLRLQEDGLWQLRLPLPVQALCEGIQVISLQVAGTGQELGSFALLAGEPLSGSALAEIALLRAELDLLKAAFRRHCNGD